MVPDGWAFAGQLHVDWLGLPPVRAKVAAAVLELLQVFDGVGAAWSGHSPHAKWQGHLLGKVIQQGIKAFEAALVDCHPDTPELAVTASVEGDPLGRGGCGHMGEAYVGEGWRGEGRGMFRWGPGVPHACLD